MKAFCRQYRYQIIVALVGVILSVVMIVVTDRHVDQIELEIHQAVRQAF